MKKRKEKEMETRRIEEDLRRKGKILKERELTLEISEERDKKRQRRREEIV